MKWECDIIVMANNRLPYGLCKKYGIELPKGATPREAWAALDKITADEFRKPLIISQKANSQVDIFIDKLTPCLEDIRTGKLVETSYSLISKEDIKQLNGLAFNWLDASLDSSEIYKLTLQNSNEVQGLVAITDLKEEQAVYVNIAERVGWKQGIKKYNGIAGHLFAIAAKRSKDLGYGGFVFMDAKNLHLVKCYQKKLGAIHIGTPHPYRMIIDENAAEKLLKIYRMED